jgi:hypothetical protein
MKSSRVMLLAAIMSTASVFASESATDNAATNQTSTQIEVKQNSVDTNNGVTTTNNSSETLTITENKKEETKTETPAQQSWTAAKLAAVSAAFGSAANLVSTPAEKLLQQLTRISYLKGGKFEANIPTMAKVVTAAALVAAAVKVYQMVNDADDVDANDDEIFGDNN